MSLLLLFTGCSVHRLLLNRLAEGPWQSLHSANAIRVFSSEQSAALESLGYVPGPVPEPQRWTLSPAQIDTFVAPVTLAFSDDGVQRGQWLPKKCAALPSELEAALGRVQPEAEGWFRGAVLPRVELRFAAPLVGVRYWESSTGTRFSDTVLRLVVAPPARFACEENLKYWVADAVEKVVHELQHVRAHQGDEHLWVLADELNASLFGHCARYLAIGRLPYDMHVGIDFGDDPIDWVHQRFDRGDVNASMGGKLMAEAMRRLVLGPGEVEGAIGRQFVELCRARQNDYRVPANTAEVLSWFRPGSHGAE